MTTAASSRATHAATRRVSSSSSPSPPPPPTIARGATARSAVSPRVSSNLKPAPARRGSIKGPSTSSVSDGRGESLSESLKHETEQKEQLLVQLQDKEQTIATLSSENHQLTTALNAAEARLNELYADQSRSEIELAQRIDISEKLRDQVRELEKERRDIQRRYNEQTATFDAERQAFYDNEQHLKSRIQSLSQARKQPAPVVSHHDIESDAETDYEEEPVASRRPETPKQDLNDPEQEPAEMTSLRLELSTLSTSHSSLQSTLVLLQTQLLDLKRVNHELQEENESYMILLREKTLSGQFDVMKQMASAGQDDDDENDADDTDVGSLRSIGRSTLERVDEEEISQVTFEQELERSLEPRDTDSVSSRNGRSTKHGRSRAASHSSSNGLDLAAELGRAENKDILSGNTIDDRDRSVLNSKNKRPKKDSDSRNVSMSDDNDGSSNDLDALRTEVKVLKDANKALSLYASKIIDRIISQEGFEHVLAVDYDKEPPTPSTAVPKSNNASKPRPQSAIIGRSSSNSEASRINSPPIPATPKLSSPPMPKVQRRSLSFDWKNFSIFNQPDKKPEANLRPLTLTPGANPVTGARKLETQEDEEDRKERERMNATLKLMGIQPQSPVPIQKSFSSPTPSHTPLSPPNSTSTTATTSKRFSWFNSRSTTADNSETSSLNSSPSLGSNDNTRTGSGLTQEALEQAEAQNSIAALDAHERSLSAEIARGSGSGFTEISPRSGRRSRRSAGGSGSGSTVWSAGIGEEGDD
ncbi:uncharacterized protein EV420DRAFT_1513269 [Desarmillaria tabescens]|uniref:Uncharacterized protein n=1 Tax=Armillaria tabescens TaxID=1929756 RepID=A0AA39U1I3_ARMTA|nr:uncharacterized protein EV420DRAFT_1513269 [Desarmillaria tabescens]KAK0465195.1 hypothetical protein EV420DRAFT_1513269 [Desarmillaria tabescens]